MAAQPERWLAHKNLVIIEAELGRWEEFDRERALLRGARERGAPGISARESDVIDAFDVRSASGGAPDFPMLTDGDRVLGHRLARAAEPGYDHQHHGPGELYQRGAYSSNPRADGGPHCHHHQP